MKRNTRLLKAVRVLLKFCERDDSGDWGGDFEDRLLVLEEYLQEAEDVYAAEGD